MDNHLLQKDWGLLTDQHEEFTQVFYDRLFERYPQYRALFPHEMGIQMQKMVKMFSNVARFADHVDVIRPYLVNVGLAHQRLGIGPEDVDNFKEIFIETLAELCAEWWDQEHSAAWHQTFETLIVPMFDEGMETGRSKNNATAT
jgi:hemoglobin-like flavoprotein